MPREVSIEIFIIIHTYAFILYFIFSIPKRMNEWMNDFCFRNNQIHRRNYFKMKRKFEIRNADELWPVKYIHSPFRSEYLNNFAFTLFWCQCYGMARNENIVGLCRASGVFLCTHTHTFWPYARANAFPLRMKKPHQKKVNPQKKRWISTTKCEREREWDFNNHHLIGIVQVLCICM